MDPRTGKNSIAETILKVLVVVAALHALFVLWVGLRQPLLDYHAFRQTDTALITAMLIEGGNWFAYETPVLGAPWSIPFEFPIYELLVAALAKLGIPLVVAGRLVSEAFFLAILWPLSMIFQDFRLGRFAYLATALLLLASPLYVYFSRTFLIETCALFFAILWFACLARSILRRSAAYALFATLAGITAILAKSTTFLPILGLGTLVGLGLLLQEARSHGRAAIVGQLVLVALAATIPLVIGILWVRYTDEVKSANAFGRWATSTALFDFNFGTLGQRFSAEFWSDTIRSRILPDVLGRLALLGIAVAVASLISRRAAIAAGVALMAFLTPLLTFTNLHVVHNYYQMANGIFLLAAVGIALGAIDRRGFHVLAVSLLVLIVAGQLYNFRKRFYSYVTRSYEADPRLRIAEAARARTAQNEALLVIWDDSDSTIPFYAQRRSLVLPAIWAPPELMTSVLQDPERFLGGLRLGAVVTCDDRLAAYDDRRPAVEEFLAGREVLDTFADCRVLSPTKGPKP